jgi:outer membrane lipase/esterase
MLKKINKNHLLTVLKTFKHVTFQCLRINNTIFNRKHLRILVLFSWFCTGSCLAEQFDQIIFFGDSLTDIGNNGVYPSNGRLWSQDLAHYYGITLKPSSQGGSDFAYSGAQSGGGIVLSVLAQVHLYDLNEKIDSHALYAVWGGANDILNQLMGGGNTPQTAASNVAKTVVELHDDGARYILVNNLADIGKSPRFAGTPFQQMLTDESNIFNNQLSKDLNNLGFDVIQLDIATLFQNVLKNPVAYGFVKNAATTSCPDNGSCQGYIFSADGMHPTTAAHQLIADYVIASLSAPNFYASLAEVAITQISVQNANIKQQLPPLQNTCQPYHWLPFFSGSYAPELHITTQNQLDYQYDTNNTNGTIGVEYLLPHNIFGGAYSYSNSNIHFDHHHGGYNTHADIVSIFSNYSLPRAYINGIASVAWLRYHDIERRFPLGPHEIIASGATTGNVYDFALNGGYIFYHNQSFITGPIINLDYAAARVSGYTENGKESEANLAYGKQRYHTFVTGLGWEANICCHLGTATLLTNIFMSGNQQWSEDHRDIHFHIATLPNSHGSLAVANPNTLFLAAGIGVKSKLHNGIIIGASYNAALGDHNLKEHIVTANIAVPLG